MDNKIVTEKATDHWDLPHGYAQDIDRAANGVCRCGRRESNTLHLPQHLAEHASASTRLTTEKGS